MKIIEEFLDARSLWNTRVRASVVEQELETLDDLACVFRSEELALQRARFMIAGTNNKSSLSK